METYWIGTYISLSPQVSEICTVVFPWGKYQYQRLPMGTSNSPDIFQAKMNELMDDLEFVQAYLDDCLIISKSTFDDHLMDLEQVLERLKKANLRVNMKRVEDP